MNDKTLNTVVLAGLLHDVGKLYQRLSYGTGTKKYHGELSKEFAEGIIIRIWANIDDYVDKDLLSELVYFHHARKIEANNTSQEGVKNLMHLVSEADNISAKERQDIDKGIEEREFNLYSVFSNLSYQNIDDKCHHNCYLQSPLWPQFFDTSNYEKDVFNDFANELKVLSPPEKKYRFWQGFNMVYNFILRIGFFLPDFTLHPCPDTSLFVHSSLCSAFCGCLYKYHKANGSLNRSGIEDKKKKKFILYKGGLTPVQKFLFDISRENPKGVAKILRGKSLLISLWTEAVAYSILYKLNLPVVNCLMKSGTNFILVLPNTEETYDVIKNVEEKVKEFLLYRLLGKINYASYSVEASSEELVDSFDEVFQNIGKGFSYAKLRPFYDYEKMQEASFGLYSKDRELYESSESAKFCEFCGVYWAENGKSDDLQELGDGGKYCFVCNWAKEVGEKLGRGNIDVSFIPSEAGSQNGKTVAYMQIDIGSDLDSAGSYVSYYTEIDSKNSKFGDRDFYSGKIYNAFSSHLPRFSQEQDICSKCRRQKGCLIKDNKGYFLTFECIAQADNYTKDGAIIGDDLLAVLKADVDNLGAVVNTHLKQIHKKGQRKVLTVSRYYIFAFLLNYFFSAVLPYKIKQGFPFVYIVYAGGDDLLLIGPWRSIIGLAKKIRDWFKEYVFNSSELNLSAGIAFFKPKSPLKWAASQADSALARAKQNKGKNSVCIALGREDYNNFVFKWDDWFHENVEDLLSAAVDNEVWGRGRIYRLLVLWKQALNVSEGSKELEDYLFVSHFRYMLSRDFSDEKVEKEKDENKKQIMERIKKDISAFYSTQADKGELKRFGLPLYLTLIKTRR